MSATFDSIRKNILAGKFEPVYFLCGEEPYYLDILEQLIDENALAPHEKDFNSAVFYGKDADPIQVLNEAKQYPSFAERRLVIVREAQDFKVKDWEIFEKYLEHPVSSSVLVFVHKNKTLDKRTKIAKVIENQTVYFESKKISDDQLPAWISDYVKNTKFGITSDAARIIAENIGNDLSRIANEIDKLSVMLAENAQITPELIELYIGISKEYNVTEFVKAVTTRDFSKAMRIILYFEKNPKAGPAIQIIAFLYNFYSKLFVVQNSTPQEASAGLGFKNGWIPDDIKGGGKYFHPQQTMRILDLLCEYDAKAKGLYAAHLSNADLLKELVVKILR
ncbi:MAG: hypothetical protein RL222_1510 [Bacteroidota bacterium]